MSPLNENPYDGNEYLQIILCDVKWENDLPKPDYGNILFALPPNGPVLINKAADFSEKEIKGSKGKKGKGVSRIELKGFKSGEVSFPMQLHTDDPGEPSPWTALEKFTYFAYAFLDLDDAGRNRVYTIKYPSVNAVGIELVFFANFDMQETEASDLMAVSVKMKEVTPAQVSRKAIEEESSPRPRSRKTDKKKMEDEAGKDQDSSKKRSWWQKAKDIFNSGKEDKKAETEAGLDDN